MPGKSLPVNQSARKTGYLLLGLAWLLMLIAVAGEVFERRTATSRP